MRSFTTALFIGLLAGQIPAFSWGNDGHELVARIAAKHLTTKTRAAVADLLRQDTQVTLPANATPAQVEDAMGTVATWPDHINKHATGTEEWHFIDIGLLEDQSAIPKRCNLPGSCVVDKITQLQANLKTNAKMGNFEPFEELKFLIHFLGDIHQPLHSATNQDAGGNCVPTTGLGENELHAVWDTGLVDVLRKAPANTRGKKSGSAHSLASNTDIAAALDQAIKSADAASWSKTTDPTAIAMESHQLAIDQAYTPLQPAIMKMPGFVAGIRPGSCNGVPPQLQHAKPWDVAQAYHDPTVAAVRTQLSKAGIRLATILNAIFDR